MHSKIKIAIALLAAGSALTFISAVGCSTDHVKSAQNQALQRGISSTRSRLPVCVAVPGNGAKVMVSAHSLARIVENTGPIYALAGSSSGALLSFLYESMLLNPALPDCDGRACSPEELGQRLSLMLKTLPGYFESLRSTPEAAAVSDLVSGWKELTQHIPRFLYDLKAYGKLSKSSRAILHSPLVHEILDPQVFQLLDVGQDLRHPHAVYERAKRTFDTQGIFSGKDKEVLYRPGLLNIHGAVRTISKIGEFYADSRADSDQAWQLFFKACSPLVKGASWLDLKQASPEILRGKSCGDLIRAMAEQDWKKKSIHSHRRIDDPIGQNLPVLIATSVLTGKKVREDLNQAVKNYQAFKPASFHPDFSSFRLGYYGSPEALDALFSSRPDPDDFITHRRFRIGASTWEDALFHTISEPGLSHMLNIPQHANTYSGGGWVHVDHAKALKAIGCENTIFITARGDETPYPIAMARLMGASQNEIDSMYSMDPKRKTPSSFYKHLLACDAVICTDWENYTDIQQTELIRDAIKAPIEVRSSDLRKLGFFSDAAASLDIQGCSLPRQ